MVRKEIPLRDLANKPVVTREMFVMWGFDANRDIHSWDDWDRQLRVYTQDEPEFLTPNEVRGLHQFPKLEPAKFVIFDDPFPPLSFWKKFRLHFTPEFWFVFLWAFTILTIVSVVANEQALAAFGVVMAVISGFEFKWTSDHD